MVQIRLYGRLRRHAHDQGAGGRDPIEAEPEIGETLGSLLVRLQIPLDEIHHVFLNNKLLATHNSMATWADYQRLRAVAQVGEADQRVRADPHDWDLSVPIESGDRVGLFGRDMAVLVV